MNIIKPTFAVVAVFIASAFTTFQSLNWKLNENTYSVTFKGTKVNGVIKGLKTDILFDESNPGKSRITASLDVNTVNTGNGMKNKHAKSEEALNLKQFKTINFETESVTGSAGKYTATGKLTIKGITKAISLPFTFENNGATALFKGKLSILTKDYNIIKKGVPDILEIDILVPVTK